MTSIEERLSSHLDAVANYVAAPDDGPASLIRHARHRQFRRRRIAASSSALLLIAAAVGVISLTADRPATVKITSGSDNETTSGDDQAQAPAPDPVSTTIAPDAAVAPATASNFVATPSTLTWTARDDVTPVSGERTRAADGVFYAIGTAPGTGGSPEMVGYVEGMFRSTDGLDWVRAPEYDQRMPAMWTGNIEDTRLYQVGTAAKTGPITPSSPGGDVVIHIDNLETGTNTETILPGFNLRELAKLSKVNFNPSPVASGPLGVLASVNVGLEMAPGAGETVPPEFERFVRGDVQLYLSTDRKTFEAVDLPPSSTTRSIVGALAGANGFTVVTSSPIHEEPAPDRSEIVAIEPNSTVTLYTSPDGRIWTEGPSTAIPAYPYQAKIVNDRIVVFGGDADNATVFASTDGVTWVAGATIPARVLSADGLPLTADYSDVRYFHDDGIAALRNGRVDQVKLNGGVSFTEDGYIFTILNEQFEVSVVEDATGEVVGSLPNPTGGGRVESRGDGFAILAADGTDDLVMTHDQFFSLSQVAVGSIVSPNQTGECRCELLYSADAATWNSVDVASVVGEPVARVMWAGRTATGWAMNVQLVRRQPSGGAPIIQVLEGR